MDYKSYMKSKKKFAKWILKQPAIFIQRENEDGCSFVYITDGYIAFKFPIETYSAYFRIESGLFPDIKDAERCTIRNQIVSNDGPDIRRIFNENPSQKEMKISNIASIIPIDKKKTVYARMFYLEGDHISFINQIFLDFIICDDPILTTQENEKSPMFFKFDAGEEALALPIMMRGYENENMVKN